VLKEVTAAPPVSSRVDPEARKLWLFSFLRIRFQLLGASSGEGERPNGEHLVKR